jgi:tetratricopeptide (TPR) repeat protein
MSKRKQILLVSIFLMAATFIAFWQVNHCDFTGYDDDGYVAENSYVQDGITVKGIRWAFSTGYYGNWHPLTWISHMLDVQLFELNPQGHHLTNLLFHIANTLLLFVVFSRMTKALWQSAFVAALFALHPLHVESVAWVAERKDVFSTFFWMLTIGAYCSFVVRPALRRYLLVLLFFVLGLMAKPMLVTLPFVLLLLDFWPLNRFEQGKLTPKEWTGVNKLGSGNKRKRKSKEKHLVKAAPKAEKSADHRYRWDLFYPLLWEKIPLFSLAALSSIITYIVQEKGGAMLNLEAFPFSVRIGNAFVSYIIYIGKMVWPSNLAVFYPHPGLWPYWQIIAAVLPLGAVTLIVIWTAKKYPYLITGWFWYLGTLVPVIGLVQVGEQARADRYTYIPLVGLFIIVAWGMPELLKGWRYRKETLFFSAGLALSCLFIVTWTQVGYWRNSLTLFEHTLKVTDRNIVAYNNRGSAYGRLGNHEQAIEDYNKAIEINPKYAVAYNNRAGSHWRRGNYKDAIEDYNKAIEFNPKYAEAYNNRAGAYGSLGDYRQAIEDSNKAIEINPKYAEAYNNRAGAYGSLGDYRRAIEDSNKAIEINPKYAEAYDNRGYAYGRLGNHKQAIEDHTKAIEINPKYAEAYNNRAGTYGDLGNYRQAIEDYSKAIEINPKYAVAYSNRGSAYGSLGNQRQAIEDYSKAIEINPKYTVAYYNRAGSYGKLGNYQQAIEDLKTAARLGHESAQKYLRSRGMGW